MEKRWVRIRPRRRREGWGRMRRYFAFVSIKYASNSWRAGVQVRTYVFINPRKIAGSIDSGR